MDLEKIILGLPAILIGLTVHEYAHGKVAFWCGDTTARDAGRLTFNPVSHLDPFGTIMLIGTLLSNFVPFGWAKPVPVNPHNLGNPKRDMVLVSAAGPASNVVCALLCGGILRIPSYFAPYFTGAGSVSQFLNIAIMVNLGLSFFNLIPIPPLDGSKILFGFLPNNLGVAYMEKARFLSIGFIALLVLEGMGLSTISYVLNPLWSSYAGFWMSLISMVL